MDQRTTAPHETIQLQELLTIKNLCVTKSSTMSILVTDEELKSILQNDVATSQQHVKELSGLMERSTITASVNTQS
jgi:similar to spore coat protein